MMVFSPAPVKSPQHQEERSVEIREKLIEKDSGSTALLGDRRHAVNMHIGTGAL